MLDAVLNWFHGRTFEDLLWLGLGMTAQALFMMRFVVQWIASERVRRSIVPIAFWYFSVAGGTLLCIYAIRQGDPVFILGQGLGLFVYLRNLSLIWSHRRRDAEEEEAEAVAGAGIAKS